MATLLTRLIDAYPYEEWDWFRLSQNPNVPLEYIEQHPKKRWNWSQMAGHPGITIDFIQRHEKKFKKYAWTHVMSLNPAVTLDFVDAFPKKAWQWGSLHRPHISLKTVLDKYATKRWNWRSLIQVAEIESPHLLTIWMETVVRKRERDSMWCGVFMNPCIIPMLDKISFVEKKTEHMYYKYMGLSRNPGLTMDVVERDLLKPWDWDQLSRHPNLPVDSLLRHKQFVHTRERELLYHPQITMAIIDEHPNFFWGLHDPSLHITAACPVLPELLNRFQEEPWYWIAMSSHASLTSDFVEQHLHRPWHWPDILAHPNIGVEFLDSPVVPKCCNRTGAIMSNPNITFEFIQRYTQRQKWVDFYSVATNMLSRHPVLIQKRLDLFHKHLSLFKAMIILKKYMMRRDWDEYLYRPPHGLMVRRGWRDIRSMQNKTTN